MLLQQLCRLMFVADRVSPLLSHVQAVQALDHPGQWDGASEAVGLAIVLGGQAAFLGVAAALEAAARLCFLRLHPSHQRQPLPRFWRSAAAAMPRGMAPRSPP